jgi:protein-S-isoprenylcysteine O-methyltransferase Ste14
MKPSALFVTVVPIPPLLFALYIAAPATWGPIDVAGLALAVSGIVLITVARVQLGNSFSVTPQAQALVTRGLYARIRNPIYVFGLVLLAGLALYVHRPLLLLVVAAIGVVQLVRAGRESKVLEERFGDEYRAYKARTWF